MRPFVFSNLAMSLDGKIATATREHFFLGTPRDRREMQRLRKKADAILCGASTLRAFRGPMRALGAKKQPLNIIISERLEGIDPGWPFFQAKGIEKILAITADPSQDQELAGRIENFRGKAGILILDGTGGRGISRAVLHALERIGVRNLLVEGGGSLMWEFARENLIDEYHVTLTPWIVGGKNAPTLVEGEGFPASRILGLKLTSAKKIRDEVYLVYRKK